MSISSILSLIVQALLLFETDQTELEAGTAVNTPSAQIGTIGGRPLYAWITLGTTRPS